MQQSANWAYTFEDGVYLQNSSCLNLCLNSMIQNFSRNFLCGDGIENLTQNMEIYSEWSSRFWIWHTISLRAVFQHHPSSRPLLNFVRKTNNWLSEKYILKTLPSVYNSMIFRTVCCFPAMYDASWACAALINKLSPEDGPSHSIILHQIANQGNGGSFIILGWNHTNNEMEWISGFRVL